MSPEAKAVMPLAGPQPSRMKEDPHPFWSAYALAETTVRSVMRSKLVWLALAVSAVHIAVRLGIIVFVSTIFPNDIGFVFNDAFFISAILMQAGAPLIVVAGIVGSSVTARDRMMGGLEFLLSKALPPWGYVAGRIMAPLTAALLLVFLPILVFDILLLALVSDLPPRAGEIMWGALGLSLLFSITFGPLAAGLGTMVDNPRKATALWLGVSWFTLPLVPIAGEMGVRWAWAFNPGATVQSAGQTLMGLSFPTATGQWFAWLLITAYITVPCLVLYWRTREVVR